MKKLLRITLIVMGSLLGLMIVLPVIFKGRIEEEVKKRINQEVEATVEWARFSASLFRGFPTLSANLHQLSVSAKGPSKHDTIATLDRFELRMNPFGILRREIDIHSILLFGPEFRGEIFENGEASWEIFPGDHTDEMEIEAGAESTEGSAIEESGRSMTLSLKKLVISEGSIRYLDRINGSDIEIEQLDLVLRGDFAAEQTRASLSIELNGLDVLQSGIRYIKGGSLAVELDADANMNEKRITLRKNELWLNGMLIEMQGEFSLQEEAAIDMDLQFQTRETSFQTLLSLIPVIYMNEYESVTAEGTFTLAGNVTGILKDTLLPDVNLALQVTDGYFSYPDLPRDVSDVQIDLNIDFRGQERDASTLELERLYMQLGGDPFELQLLVDHPFSDMHLTGKALGTIDFSNIGDIVPLEDIRMEGKLVTDLLWDTRMSDIEEERFEEVELNGNLKVSGFGLEHSDLPVPVRLHRMEMMFTPRLVELQSLEMELGSSDLQMKGQLYNFIPYLFDNKIVHGSLQLTSGYFDINELMVAMEDSITGQGDSVAYATKETQLTQAPPDSIATPVKFEIPELIDFNMELDMDQIVFDELLLNHVEGIIRIGEGMAYVDRLRSEILEGRIDLTGEADTHGAYMRVDASVQVDGLDIPTAYEKFISVERLVPMARYCMGTANLNMRYSSFMDNTFTPLYGSIDAQGRVFTEGLKINNLQGFVNIKDLVRNKKMQEMAPDEVEIEFTILNGRVQVAPFDIDFDDSKITVSGSHGIDHSLDYLVDMNIAKKDLGAGAMSMVNSMTLMARAAGMKVADSEYVKVKASITGTVTKPVVKTDLSGNLGSTGTSVREQIENKVKGEIEAAEKELRQEASQRADQIIADAEAEAAEIVEKARKNGDQLVKEAELQGDKLIEEAGDNALQKMAAERAAQELTAQAQKQSDRMVAEAEKKAAEIVEKAREEASRL